MKTIYELQQEAIRLRQVKEVDSISPEETFGLHAIPWRILQTWSRMRMVLASIRCTRAMQQ